MYERRTFAGLDEARLLPKGYRRLMKRHGEPDEPETFIQTLEHLEEAYNIEWRDLFHITSKAGSSPGVHNDGMHKVDNYKALINPKWEAMGQLDLPGDREDSVWHIPTTRYTKVAHHEAWRPLAKAIVKRGDHSQLFGSARVRRQGGEVHMDLFFSDVEIPGLDDTNERITLGISTGHDYFGNTRLYVDVVGYHETGDGVGQVMRYLVDPRRRKHTGDAGQEVVSWYDDSIERLDSASSKLHNVVATAMNHTMDLSEIPCSKVGFYSHLGLPSRANDSLANIAGQRAIDTTVGEYTAWHMYKAGMWAIEHSYDSRDTSAFKKHVGTVNTLLFNPSLAEQRVLRSIEEDLLEVPDENAEIWDYINDDEDREDALTQVRTRAESISEGVEEFNSTKERLTTLLNDDGVEVQESGESEPDFESTSEEADS